MTALNPTTRILEAFQEKKEKPRFLASLFMYDGEVQTQEDFEYDVQRDARPVAVPVPSLASGPRLNQVNAFTNKHGQAPILLEQIDSTVYEGNHRPFGGTLTDSVDVAAHVMRNIETGINSVTGKIVRNIELQAAQVLQTGAITTIDSTGATVFSQDYGMKASHKITSANAWSNTTTGTPVTDLETGCRVVKRDSGKRVTKAIFDSTSWINFRAHPQVQALINSQLWNRYAPPPAGQEFLLELGNYQGTITIDGTALELWTYDGVYLPANSGTEATFLSANKVILVAETPRRKILIGNIPRLRAADPLLARVVPQTLKVSGPGGYAVDLHSFISQDGLVATVQMGCRPVVVPQDLDSFACLTTA